MSLEGLTVESLHARLLIAEALLVHLQSLEIARTALC
jgi:hypothetical protein